MCSFWMANASFMLLCVMFLRPACLSACLLPSPAHVPAPVPLCLKAVHVAENGTHYVSMTSLIPHLVAALQSLHCQQLAQGDDLDDLRQQVGCTVLCVSVCMTSYVSTRVPAHHMRQGIWCCNQSDHDYSFISVCLPFFLHLASCCSWRPWRHCSLPSQLAASRN